MNGRATRPTALLLLWGAVLILAAESIAAAACTNVLVTPGASATGSSFTTYSCDGGVFAAVDIVEGGAHEPGAWLDLVADPTYEEGDRTPERALLGMIPQVPRTYRYVDVRGGVGFYHIGGVNECGVSIAESSLVGGRTELECERGSMAPFSACAARSLMGLALARAATARDAIRVIGSLAENYGYASPFPVDGEQFAISDGREAWSMEIFGPGADWVPGCGRPGAVWCAQRIPDGSVGVSANRSRIGEIDLENPSFFMASGNVLELAVRYGWWNPSSSRPFVWYEAYAPSSRRGDVMREWRVLSLAAPSLGLRPEDERFPFSVRAERKLSTIDVVALQRDLLAGTAYDPMALPGFVVDGEESPLASPQADPALYSLLGAAPERTISNRYASFSCLYETRLDRPDTMRGCAWFGFGPAATSCYVPVYAGSIAVDPDWARIDLAAGGLDLPFWTMTRPGQLAPLRWREAFPLIQAVRDPAEAAFMSEAGELAALVAADADGGAARLSFVTQARMAAVEAAFDALGDFLQVAVLSASAGAVTVTLPSVLLPVLDPP